MNVPRLRNGRYMTKKMVTSGDIIEIYEYENPILVGHKVSNLGRGSEATEEDKLKNREDVSNRAKRELRRIINTNVFRWYDSYARPYSPVFLTLTFRENITDLDIAHKEFRDFLLRLNYRLNGTRKNTLKYVVVIEFQKRGAIHYHSIFFNLPYIPVNEIAKLWGQGFIKANVITEVDNIGSYVSKYIGKDLLDDRLVGRKCYFQSRGLLKPLESTNENEIDQLALGLPQEKIRYQNTFHNNHIGTVHYSQYNLKSKDNDGGKNHVI